MKTLKDISNFCDEEGCNTPSMAQREELRQSTIDDIKELSKSKVDAKQFIRNSGKIEYIMEKFNIEEEDLE